MHIREDSAVCVFILAMPFSYCEVQPFIFRPATPRTEPRQTANVCIMQITSCPHKQAGTNQCQSPFPRPINVIPSPTKVALIEKALFLGVCVLHQEGRGVENAHIHALNLRNHLCATGKK